MGEVRGEKWNPASLSQMCLLSCHYTTHLDTSASATTAFIFPLTVIGTRESHAEHSENLIYTKKNVWLGFSEGAGQPQGWQVLVSAFALKPAAASLSGCLVSKK